MYFASGKSAFDAEANKSLAVAIDYLKAHPDTKVMLSGFVDASGNATRNAELAKVRAFAVRDALTAAGIDASRIELRKPETITAGGSADKSARRVEIKPVG